jgi:hypothetical protein
MPKVKAPGKPAQEFPYTQAGIAKAKASAKAAGGKMTFDPKAKKAKKAK